MKQSTVALRLAVEGVIAFALVVLMVAKFERELLAINWKLVALLCGVLVLAYAFYYFQTSQDNTYEILDLLMTNGRADPWKHFALFFAFVSAWLIAQQALSDKPVENLLTITLGCFVGKVAVDSVSNAIAGRVAPKDPPPPDPPKPVAAADPPEHPYG